MTKLTDRVWASPVPQDKTCQPEDMTFANFYPHASKEVDEMIWIKCNGNSFTQKIPPGTYRFIFTTKDVKKIPNGIVECKIVEYDGKVQGTRFVNYTDPNQRRWFINKADSLKSLLRSKGLDDKNNYAIIEKL